MTHLEVVIRTHVGGYKFPENAIEGSIGMRPPGPPLGEGRRSRLLVQKVTQARIVRQPPEDKEGNVEL